MSLDPPAPSAAPGAASLRIGVAAARYNARLVEGLLARVTARLRAAGIREKNLPVVRVPGSNELPVAAQLLAARYRFDALIALGVVIRGGTPHYELIARSSSEGLQQVALAARLPVINGVIVAESEAQAEERCLGPIDRGAEFAAAALEMAALRRALL